MKVLFLTFPLLLLSTSLLFGNQLKEIVRPESGYLKTLKEDAGFVLVDYDYRNYLSLKSDKGTKTEVGESNIGISSRLKWKKYRMELNGGVLNRQFTIDNLIDPEDNAKLKSSYNSLHLSLGRSFDHFSVKGGLFFDEVFGGELEGELKTDFGRFKLRSALEPWRMKLEVDVQEEFTSIPLDANIWSNRFSFRDGRTESSIGVSLIFPSGKENNFETNPEGYSISIADEYRYEDFIFRSDFSHTVISAELYYMDSRYGKLDNLAISIGGVSIGYDIGYGFSASSGVIGAMSDVDDDSFIDATPFSFWDMFLASRTRLKKFYNRAALPFLSAKYDFEWQYKKLKGVLDINLSYHHLFFESDIVYRERKSVLFPIATKYTTKEADLSTSIDGIGRISLKKELRFYDFVLQLSAHQIVPVDFGRLKSKTGTSSKKYEKMWGGTTATVNIGYILN